MGSLKQAVRKIDVFLNESGGEVSRATRKKEPLKPKASNTSYIPTVCPILMPSQIAPGPQGGKKDVFWLVSFMCAEISFQSTQISSWQLCKQRYRKAFVFGWMKETAEDKQSFKK